MHDPPDEEPVTDAVEQYVEQARTLVATYGWAVQHVPGAKGQQPFTYTIGLTASHGHPELLVTGLPDDIAGRIINEVAVRIRDGEVFTAHQRYGDVLAGYDVVLLPITEAHLRDRFVLARRLYPQLAFDALQVVWPDAEGRFPWEPESTADAPGQVIVGAVPPAG